MSQSHTRIWNEAIRAAAKTTETPNRAGREWVPGSLWEAIRIDTARDILKLLIDEEDEPDA
jgi:hypothetical protein